MEKRIGLYLDERVEGVMKMPTETAQEVLDKYYTPISGEEMDYISENLYKLSKKVQQMDLALADETLAFLRRNKDFDKGYRMLPKEDRAHLYLVLLAQQDLRSLENLSYTKTFQ